MSERILIVEDDDALRYALCREVEAAGYDATQAHDYRDALDVLESGKRVSVLVVDLVLPRVNGFALARMARMRHPNIKTIYMTGFESIPMHEADGPVLHKPLQPDVLLATIRDSLSAM
jgi:DNA-binding response OmpR family regulator